MQVRSYNMNTANGSPTRRGTVAKLLLVLSGLIVMASAESHAIHFTKPLSVVFALDVSDSITNSDKAVAYITDSVQHHLPRGTEDLQSLIVFGKTAAVELLPARNFRFEAIKSQIDRSGTNLEQALSTCGDIINDNVQGRIVLIGDGLQTEGDPSGILAELKSRRVAVDVLPVNYSYDKEVWLEAFELRPRARPGETYDATVTLSSLGDGQGKLVLRENGDVIAEQLVDYQSGNNRFSLAIELKSAAYHEIAATIEVPKSQDHIVQNNTISSYLRVDGSVKVLLATNAMGDSRDWKRLNHVLRQGSREVEMIDTFPRAAASLANYNVIIFNNVPRDEFDSQQLQAVRDAVHDYGIGFLMIGGTNSFGPGGYRHTPIEEILPVSMDKPWNQPKTAVVIVLDRNRFPEGNTWNKRVVKEAIRLLRPDDEVGVIAATETKEAWLFELTPASKYESLVPVINGASMNSLWSFQDTMEMGLKGLMSSDASIKQMIILSDGSPSMPSKKLIQQFMDAKVSVSMVAVIPNEGHDFSKMHAIAEVTGGRYYLTDDPSKLPAIFLNEMKPVKGDGLQYKTFVPTTGIPSPVLNELPQIPELKGYVITSGKGHPAMQILSVPPNSKGSNVLDPILSIWQHGLGKTAAFTSDLGQNWGASWQSWDGFPRFVDQLITEISPKTYLHTMAYASAREVVVDVEDTHPQESALEIEATLSGPDQKSETVMLTQTGSRRYRVRLPLWSQGRYNVVLRESSGVRLDFAATGFGMNVTYTPEHLQFRSNRQSLQEIADLTGGRVLSGDPVKDAVYAQQRSLQSRSQSSFDWFLIVLALLIPFKAVTRRIGAEVIVLWDNAMHPRPAPATATMARLLKTKRWLTEALSSKGTGRLLIQIWSPAPRPQWSKPRTTAKSNGATADASSNATRESESTIEKLLALKRQQDEQK